MREISEDDVYRLAGDAVPPLLCKEENEATESAVALKRLPSCYVLGVSCDTQDRFTMYAFDDEAEARAAYERHVAQMRETGAPFFD